MSEHDYFYEHGEFPNLNTPDQVEFLQSRLFNIMVAQHTGFGLDGWGRNEDALTWSQLMLDDLLLDLKFNEFSPGFEYDDGTKVKEDLPEYALFAIEAISAAPNLERNHKIKVLADYPDLLYVSGFTFTKRGARTRVSRKLKESTPVLDYDKANHRNLVKTVERRWRNNRFDKTLRLLGSASLFYFPKTS